MRKLTLLLVVGLFVLATAAGAAWRMNPHTRVLDYYERGTDNACTVTGQVPTWDNTAQAYTCDTPAGTGDVVGPASANDGYFALWDNTTGKRLKDGFSSVNPAFNSINVTGTTGVAVGSTAVGGQGRIVLKSGVAANSNTFTIVTDNTGGGLGASLSWILPKAAAGGANYLLNVDVDGTMGYTDPAGFLAPDGDGSSLTGITSGQVSGLGTMATQAADSVNIDGGAIDNTPIGATTPSTGKFTTLEFDEATSTCVPADNNCGQTATNVGSPAGANLSAGLQWFDNTTQCFMIRNNDNTANITMSCLTKSFSFGIDNVVDGDDIFVWMDLPRAITITKITCFASTDNVIGVLQECTAADTTSCTNVDDTDWTIGGVTAATVGTTYDSGFENPGIAAGAYLKWITTSVGTTNSNKLSCTVRYTE